MVKSKNGYAADSKSNALNLSKSLTYLITLKCVSRGKGMSTIVEFRYKEVYTVDPIYADFIGSYCATKKSGPFLHSDSLYKMDKTCWVTQ